jgi:hypothetical protein
MIVDEAYRAAEILNSDMEQIQQWSDQWLVNLNQRKTEPMVISNKCINPHHPPIYMNDAIMREVEQHKHLGVIFQGHRMKYHLLRLFVYDPTNNF